eukprot:scaffold36306_cov62-Phaeocystis_antarctica.AAC.2
MALRPPSRGLRRLATAVVSSFSCGLGMRGAGSTASLDLVMEGLGSTGGGGPPPLGLVVVVREPGLHALLLLRVIVGVHLIRGRGRVRVGVHLRWTWASDPGRTGAP